MTKSKCTGNECFTGFAIDLLNELSKIHSFNYILHEVSSYGIFDAKKEKWDGLMGELIADDGEKTVGDFISANNLNFSFICHHIQKADMGIGAISITYERQQHIEFTKPFRDLQMGILLGSSKEVSYDPWSFLNPFTIRLWGLTLLTSIIIGLAISFIEKISPYGHHGTQR